MVTKQIVNNITRKLRSANDIKYLVVHYTGNHNKSANAKMHWQYFDKPGSNASTDFVVDENEIWKLNDYLKFYTWAVGDGKGKYGITNANSISLEICVNGNLQRAIDNAVVVFRQLVKEFPKAQVVRHWDASRKLCPIFFVDMGIAGWNDSYIDFRKAVFTQPMYEPFISGINVAFDKGIITSKAYWRGKAEKDADIRQLFINIGNKMG